MRYLTVGGVEFPFDPEKSALYIVDRAGTVLVVNDRALELLGDPAAGSSDIDLQAWAARVPATDDEGRLLTTEERATFRVLNGETITDCRYFLRRPSGEWFRAKLDGAPVIGDDGEVRAAVMVYSEIRRLDEILESLSEVRERLAAIDVIAMNDERASEGRSDE